MRNFLFISSLTVAVFIYASSLLSLTLPSVIRSYANDFLCIPLVLETCRRCASWILKINNLQLNLFTIFSVCLYFSTYFEYYLPTFNVRYTGDWIDVMLYLIGGVIFYFLQKMHIENKLKDSSCKKALSKDVC